MVIVSDLEVLGAPQKARKKEKRQKWKADGCWIAVVDGRWMVNAVPHDAPTTSAVSG